MVAVAVLLSRPEWTVGGLWISPAVIVALFSAWFYLRLELTGPGRAEMTVLMGLVGMGRASVGGAEHDGVAEQRHRRVRGGGAVIQFVGHYYEGKKPAFVDDVSGLIVGPLFVVAEVAFCWGCGKA